MSKRANVEEIFKKYKDKVYRLAISIVRNEKDAEDIMQNTFIKIIDNLKSFRNESLISTWIYKIAYNEALMYLRKRRSQFNLSNYIERQTKKKELGLFMNWSKLPDEHLLDGELKKRVDSAIMQMPIKYRMPLLLDSVEGMPLKDISKILGLRINSLKTRLHRAHRMINQEFSGYLKDKQEEEENANPRCSIWNGFLYSYARGYLGKKRKEAFNKHIKGCPGCESFLKSYVKAIQFTEGLSCRDLPVELQNKIESFVLELTKKKL